MRPHHLEIITPGEREIILRKVRHLILFKFSGTGKRRIHNLLSRLRNNPNPKEVGYRRERLVVAVLNAAHDAGFIPWVNQVERCKRKTPLDHQKIDFVIKTNLNDTPFFYLQCKSSESARKKHYNWQYKNVNLEEVVPCVVVNETYMDTADILLAVLIEIICFNRNLAPLIIGKKVNE